MALSKFYQGFNNYPLSSYLEQPNVRLSKNLILHYLRFILTLFAKFKDKFNNFGKFKDFGFS